jgi:voltage-gated potassium channel
VREPSGQFQPQPPAETLLHAGDVVMAMGTERTMERLEELFAPAPTRTRS